MTTIYQNARSEKEVREEIEAIRAASREIRKSPQSALDFLVKNGFVTPDGKLTKEYGGR